MVIQQYSKNRKVIAVSGTHGKTTTTAMIAWIFQDQGIEVGYLIAGKPKDFEKSARKGKTGYIRFRSR